MTKRRGRKKPSLYALSRETLKPKHQEQFLNELLGGSDRAAALVAAADLQSYLVSLVMFKFVRLPEDERGALFFGRNAALSDFADQITVAYGLGSIFDDEHSDLQSIRRIRNAFAHAVIPLTFDTEEIAEECSKLHYRNTFGDDSQSFGKPKLRYLLTVLSLRKIFFDRAFATVESAILAGDDDESRAEFMSELHALKKPNS